MSRNVYLALFCSVASALGVQKSVDENGRIGTSFADDGAASQMGTGEKISVLTLNTNSYSQMGMIDDQDWAKKCVDIVNNMCVEGLRQFIFDVSFQIRDGMGVPREHVTFLQDASESMFPHLSDNNPHLSNGRHHVEYQGHHFFFVQAKRHDDGRRAGMVTIIDDELLDDSFEFTSGYFDGDPDRV